MVISGFSIHVLNHSAFRIGLLSASAIAGYCAVLPAVETSRTKSLPLIEARWAGQIEQPADVAAAPMTPVTSASYTQREATAVSKSASVGDLKKLSSIAAVKPVKPIDASAHPVRRPEDLAGSKPPKTDKAAEPMYSEAVAWNTSHPTPDPKTFESKSFSRRWLSPVSDRLPSPGTLMKPVRMVSDAFSGLMEAF